MKTTGRHDSLAGKPLSSLLKCGQELVRKAESQASNPLNQNLHFNKG